MSFKDRFDRITAEVEGLAGDYGYDGYMSAKDIFETICKHNGCTARDLNTIFTFISGKSLIKYIKDRKMMATYELMLRDKDYDAQSYIDCSGYDTDSSFSTGFSKMFGMNPTTAHKLKDKTRLEPPVSIDSLLSGSKSQDDGETNVSEKVFGLPKDVIDQYNEICEYQALYGLEDMYAELAVYISKNTGSELEEAFRDVDTLVMDYEEISEKKSLKEMLDYIKKEIPVVFVKYLYPDVPLPELNNWHSLMKLEGGSALEETPEFVRAFIDDASDGYSYKELKELYNDYEQHYKTKYDFTDYLIAIQMCDSIEEYEEMINSSVQELQSGRYLDTAEECNWAVYDEKHFEDM